jgi:hypothetical protein
MTRTGIIQSIVGGDVRRLCSIYDVRFTMYDLKPEFADERLGGLGAPG